MSIFPCLLTTTGIASGCEAPGYDRYAAGGIGKGMEVAFRSRSHRLSPLRWEWVREWWRVYGPAYGGHNGGMRIIIVRRGSDLIGVLPLYQRSTSVPWGSRQLRFISTGAAEFEETSAEYLDLLHAPQESQTCIELISRLVNTLVWDEVHFSDISAQSPLLGLRGRMRTWFQRAREIAAGPCHLFDISGGFEAYLGRLSHENRRQARKLLRAADQVGMTFEVASNRESIDQFYDQMVTLHRQRWAAAGKEGSFAPSCGVPPEDGPIALAERKSYSRPPRP